MSALIGCLIKPALRVYSRIGQALLIVTIMVLPSCALVPGAGVLSISDHHRQTSNNRNEPLLLRMNAADAAYQAGRWPQATAHYRVVLEQVPDDAYAWFRLGNSLTRQGHYSPAIQAYEQSLQHDAGQSKPWLNLSTAHLLGAQVATLKAWEVLPRNDPSRAVVKARLETLTQLLN